MIRTLLMPPDGALVPLIGQGTWQLGDSADRHDRELHTLQRGIELGLTLIDTAEMYGNGRSERLIRQAIAHVDREKLFLVSKVLPNNAGRDHIFDSCERSLRNLGTHYLDLYLLHWRSGNIPLAETVACMEELVHSGKIRRWGVSNFDLVDMEELWNVPNGNNCATNQVLYHLGSRGIELGLLPWMRAHNVPLMAYCPIAQAGGLKKELYTNKVVNEVAQRHSASVAQILLAFVLHHNDIIAIPKASTIKHVEENAAADVIRLSENDWDKLDAAFPAPTHRVPLDLV